MGITDVSGLHAGVAGDLDGGADTSGFPLCTFFFVIFSLVSFFVIESHFGHSVNLCVLVLSVRPKMASRELWFSV